VARSVVLRALVLFAGLGAVSSGCGGKDPYNPGAQLGTFHVSAKLLGTTCGQTPNPWEFDVRLNNDGQTLYWIQGGAPISADVNVQTARAALVTESVHDLRKADARAKLAACVVSRKDKLDVMLVGEDAKPSPDPSLAKGFVGSLSYVFAPTDGSDCQDQLLATRGDFEQLPCTVEYELTGTFKEGPKK
jgi:hypothetical protein